MVFWHHPEGNRVNDSDSLSYLISRDVIASKTNFHVSILEPEKEQLYDFSIYEEGDTKYSSNFRNAPKMGCFGFIVMYMVNRNQRRARLNQKSLISRNRVKTGFKQSARSEDAFDHKFRNIQNI